MITILGSLRYSCCNPIDTIETDKDEYDPPIILHQLKFGGFSIICSPTATDGFKQ